MFADKASEAAGLVTGEVEIIVLPGLRGQPHLRRPERYVAEIERFVAAGH